MNYKELQAIKDRSDKASGKSWHWYQGAAGTYLHIRDELDRPILWDYPNGGIGVYSREDASFIEHARKDIILLLDEVTRLQAERDHYKDTLSIARNTIQVISRTLGKED